MWYLNSLPINKYKLISNIKKKYFKYSLYSESLMYKYKKFRPEKIKIRIKAI